MSNHQRAKQNEWMEQKALLKEMAKRKPTDGKPYTAQWFIDKAKEVINEQGNSRRD